VNIELIVSIATFIGAITSLLAAIAAYRKNKIEAVITQKKFLQQEEQHKKDRTKQVAEDTEGLYRRLTEQYQAITQKDKKLLTTVTFVVRRLLVLERELQDILGDLEEVMENHLPESERINCPFYSEISQMQYEKIREIEQVFTETMDELDSVLFNGQGPFLRHVNGK
jgi:iron-sulfur cluster repair protein YtfE (RIC family)